MIIDQKIQDKILTPDVRCLLAAVQGKIVGGAVRDALLSRAIGDIDIATPLPPDQVTEILNAQNIKCVPTGIAHGTVTAVIDRKGYEITTLRRDVQTDGRHAVVAFTDDWRLDASRRDFTMNALYCDVDGTISDYFNGADDAQQGHVRFIGDAQMRIKEDVLRILRFFRFFAHFGKGTADPDALAACSGLAHLIPNLSAERVSNETIKLLAAADPVPALRLMQESGVTAQFLKEAQNLPRLEKLLATEKTVQIKTNSFTRLTALLPEDETIASLVATRLKLSKRDGEKIFTLATLPALVKNNLENAPLRRLLYHFGADYCCDAVLLNGEQVAQALGTIQSWENPVFPIKGENLIKLGLTPGPQMGSLLRDVEEWWMGQDFHPGHDACVAEAKRRNAQ